MGKITLHQGGLGIGDVPEAEITDEILTINDKGRVTRLPSDKLNDLFMSPPIGKTFQPTLTANGASYSFDTSVATEYKIGDLVFFNVFLSAIEFSGTPNGVLTLGGFTYSARDITMGILGNFGGSTYAGIENLVPLIRKNGTIQFLDKTNAVTGIQNIDFTFGRIRVCGTYLTNE